MSILVSIQNKEGALVLRRVRNEARLDALRHDETRPRLQRRPTVKTLYRKDNVTVSAIVPSWESRFAPKKKVKVLERTRCLFLTTARDANDRLNALCGALRTYKPLSAARRVKVAETARNDFWSVYLQHDQSPYPSGLHKATSHKPQATSNKQQATSNKQQAIDSAFGAVITLPEATPHKSYCATLPRTMTARRIAYKAKRGASRFAYAAPQEFLPLDC